MKKLFIIIYLAVFILSCTDELARLPRKATSATSYKHTPKSIKELVVAIKTELKAQGTNGTLNWKADLNNIDTSGIKTMQELFAGEWQGSKYGYGLHRFQGDISNWNVKNVRSMRSMFLESVFNGDISQWNVSKVTTMEYMFVNAKSFNGNISQWNVSKVTNMFSMFFGATKFNKDLSAWGEKLNPAIKKIDNTLKAKGEFAKAAYMFNDTAIESLPLWCKGACRKETKKKKLPESKEGEVGEKDVDRTDDDDDDTGDEEKEKLPESKEGAVGEKDADIADDDDDDMGDEEKEKLPESEEGEVGEKDVDIAYAEDEVCKGKVCTWWKSLEAEESREEPRQRRAPKTIEELVVAIKIELKAQGKNGKLNWKADLNNIDTSRIQTMRELFASYKYNLQDRSERWKVKEYGYGLHRFQGDISKWNVKNVKNMRSMFLESSFNGDISDWNVSEVTTMRYMFVNAKFSRNKDIEKWNVENVRSMFQMFSNSPLDAYEKWPSWFSTLKNNAIWGFTCFSWFFCVPI